MQTLICPSCGLEKNKNQFIGNICKHCYYKDKAKFDVNLKELIICKSCGRLKQGFTWKAFAEDSMADIIKHNIKANFDYNIKDIDIEFFKNKLQATVDFKVGKDLFKEIVSFTPKYQYCQDCYKKIADFHEAVVQLRGFGTEKYLEKEFFQMLEKSKKEELKKGNFCAFLQKYEAVGNGVDFYLGSKGLAQAFIREITDKYRIEKKISYKLVGILPGGKEKIRTTFLIKKYEAPKKEDDSFQR